MTFRPCGAYWFLHTAEGLLDMAIRIVIGGLMLLRSTLRRRRLLAQRPDLTGRWTYNLNAER